jgi:hypothetical protein
VARIVRIYGDSIVVARWETEASAELEPFLGQLDTAMAMIRAEGIPAMRASFVDEMPRSTGAGQTFILLREDLGIPAWSLAEVNNDTLFTWIEALPFLWRSPERLATRLAHEMAHQYQLMYMHESRPTPGLPTASGASFWAIEGGADLLSYEMMRRLAGVSPNSNHDWRTPPSDTVTKLYQQRAQPAGGVLTDGFDHAMGFLRDLTARRVRSGESHADALRAVSRGAIEGWYGHDGVTQRVGLVARMQSRFGTTWQPTTALLDWALGYAGERAISGSQLTADLGSAAGPNVRLARRCLLERVADHGVPLQALRQPRLCAAVRQRRGRARRDRAVRDTGRLEDPADPLSARSRLRASAPKPSRPS